MSDILMSHPESGGEYPAKPSQVPHLKGAGWEVAPDQDESQVEEWPAEVQRFEGQPVVRLFNPGSGAYYDAPSSAVAQLRSAGWVPAEEVEAEELEDKKVAELRELAKERGISPIPATKAELIEALNAEQPQGDDQPQDTDQAGDEPARDSEEGD